MRYWLFWIGIAGTISPGNFHPDLIRWISLFMMCIGAALIWNHNGRLTR